MEYELSTVLSSGGNQYEVELKTTVTVDLDGFCICDDDDYAAVAAAGIDVDTVLDGTLMCPKVAGDNNTGDEAEDTAFREAVEYAANYSGFDVEEFIKNNK